MATTQTVTAKLGPPDAIATLSQAITDLPAALPDHHLETLRSSQANNLRSRFSRHFNSHRHRETKKEIMAVVCFAYIAGDTLVRCEWLRSNAI